MMRVNFVVDDCFDPFLETFVRRRTWIGCTMLGLVAAAAWQRRPPSEVEEGRGPEADWDIWLGLR